MRGITGSPELGSVTVGVDGSEPARRAALWAAAEAARRGSTLRIVHATDTDSRVLYLSVENIERVRRAGHELLRETAAAITELHSDLHVTTEFSGGAAVPSLRRTAGPRGTVVVGNRGLGGFKNLLLGSVGLKVAAEATTPVVIVRGTDEGRREAWCLPRSVTSTMPNALGMRRAKPRSTRLRCGCCMCGAFSDPLDLP
ncbi:universal stress protein [Streptomyces sp. NBC_00439]|uniref:universal stress protein n=1 Tax=Streptomyces sp. NBC_00439 TaxID=2903650 RepID=UPI002B1E4318|nr:universal stress protein [Streptomyces sp. NBC_00439]